MVLCVGLIILTFGNLQSFQTEKMMEKFLEERFQEEQQMK